MSKKSKKIETGIYTIDTKKKPDILPKEENNKIIYTIVGSQSRLKDGLPILIGKNAEQNKEAYAKTETINGITSYFIRINDSDELINPLTITPDNNHHKFKVLKGDQLWQFKKVNQECFNYYLEMLRTRNTLYLKFAERAR